MTVSTPPFPLLETIESPADLRRRCRVGLTQLRGFLQACLFLGLVYWVPGSRR